MASSDTLQAIKYERGKLGVLDQRRLPLEFHYDNVTTCEEAFECIRSMKVRGAPAIAIVAALGLAVELLPKAQKWDASSSNPSHEDVIAYVGTRLDYLTQSRPTAVDLSNAVKALKAVVAAVPTSASSGLASTPQAPIIEAYINAAESIFAKDTATNKSIGTHGVCWLQSIAASMGLSGKISIITHCNTGSLATSGHGTALGVVRSLHAAVMLDHVFCTETRPYNQGSRLTGFELVHDGIPGTLITDSMAGALMAERTRLLKQNNDQDGVSSGQGLGVGLSQQETERRRRVKNLAAVIVGADRVVRNGDTANKIGTYSLAVLARFHGVKFIVAAPTTTIDLDTATGDGIEIEQRSGKEVTQVRGAVIDTASGKVDKSRYETVVTADQNINVWNPAFDVTPHELIDAIVTELGVVVKNADGMFEFDKIVPDKWAKVKG